MCRTGRSLVLISLALPMVLTSCGGGGAADNTGTPPVLLAPAPTPTPPTPTPSPTPGATLRGGAINERVGLKQLDVFPVLSWFYRPEVVGEANGTDLVEFGYDASRSLSVMTVPGYPRGGLIEFATETSDDQSYSHIDPSFGTASSFDRGLSVLLLVPGLQNRIFALESTSVGWIGWQGINTAPGDKITGVLVYGVPTAASELSTTGLGRFQLYGHDVRRASGNLGVASINNARGSVEVNFATGAFSGSFESGTSPDRFEFGPTIVSGDGSFSGTITVPGLAGTAQFEGRFTGPQARELMLRWHAPYRDAAGRTQIAYGVLAGRRN